MITGTVVNRHAYITVPISSAAGRGNIEFVLDTGFTGVITLPPAACTALALPLARYQPSYLADSSSVLLEVYIATLLWNNEERDVEVLALEGAPLIGMTMLEGHEIHLQIADGGLVRIERL